MRPDEAIVTYDVRVTGIRKYKGARGATYSVRWTLNGKRTQRTFSTVKLAESFRATLSVAMRDGQAFDLASGLPTSLVPKSEPLSWFSHAMSYALFKWPNASPRHRKGIAEALTTVSVALVREGASVPDEVPLRRALNRWAFNAGAQSSELPEEHRQAINWIERESLPLSSLEDLSVVRRALEALCSTLDGRQASHATIVRKRATLSNALEYAVERGHFETNPVRRVKFRLAKTDNAVGRRIVVNPHQARTLLAAVEERDPALEGFFACLYYAGLRPAEARNVKLDDLTLPQHGWGSLVLTSSHQYSGSSWTDSGKADEERQLKHRSRHDIRRVPLPPDLVETLRHHVERFPLGVEGRLFVTRTGRAGVPVAAPYQNPVSMGIVYSAWRRARQSALTPRQVDSPLARRPYDLRHACLSTWLNAGVPPAQVAAWAGHGVDVLLRVYAKCVDGEEAAAHLRIQNALRPSAPD